MLCLILFPVNPVTADLTFILHSTHIVSGDPWGTGDGGGECRGNNSRIFVLREVPSWCGGTCLSPRKVDPAIILGG